jgi:hypothetical protein
VQASSWVVIEVSAKITIGLDLKPRETPLASPSTAAAYLLPRTTYPTACAASLFTLHFCPNPALALALALARCINSIPSLQSASCPVPDHTFVRCLRSLRLAICCTSAYLHCFYLYAGVAWLYALHRRQHDHFQQSITSSNIITSTTTTITSITSITS